MSRKNNGKEFLWEGYYNCPVWDYALGYKDYEAFFLNC